MIRSRLTTAGLTGERAISGKRRDNSHDIRGNYPTGHGSQSTDDSKNGKRIADETATAAHKAERLPASAVESEERFYGRCAELLGGEHARERFPYHVRNRWNNRAPGHGRFPGHGLIRLFGSRVHLALHHPRQVHRWFDSADEALDFLWRLRRSMSRADRDVGEVAAPTHGNNIAA